MKDLKTITKLVKAILEEDEITRNSDSWLYLKVIEHIAKEKDINLYGISVPWFLANMSVMGFPPFESVRRTRQKIQATFPELASNDKVAAMRSENEVEYKAYAVGVLTDD